MEYIIAFVMKECCKWGGRRGAHPVLLARSQNGMGPKAVFMRDFSVPLTTEGIFYLIMIFLSNCFVVDNNFFIFVESIRKSSLND